MALAVALLVTSCQPRAGRPSPARCGPPASDGPNIVLISTDDQAVVDLRWMPITRRLIGDAGRRLLQLHRPAPAVLPRPGPDPDRAVRPEQRRPRQPRDSTAATRASTTPSTPCRSGCATPATARRSSASTSTATTPRWASRRAGRTGTPRSGSATSTSCSTTAARSPSRRATTPTTSPSRTTDGDRRARRRRPAVLPLVVVLRAARDLLGHPRDRLLDAAAGGAAVRAQLPRGPAAVPRQARRSTSPTCPTSRRSSPGAARSTSRKAKRLFLQRIRSLASVDRAVAEIVTALRAGR